MPSPTTLGGVGMAAVGSFPVASSSGPLTPGTFLIMDGKILGDELQAFSLNITEGLAGQRSLRFVHKDLTGLIHLDVGQRIILRDETVSLFTGTITKLDETRVPGPSDALLTSIEATDLWATLERRLVTVARSFINVLSGDIVRDLHATYLVGESITVNSVQNGANVAEFTVKAFASVAKALRDLSDRTSFIAFVDAQGDLNWVPQTEMQAPFSIGEAAGAGIVVPLDDVTKSENRQKYRNRQTVRFGSDLALTVTVDNLTEQAARKVVEGGSGIYHAVQDERDISTSAEATALANALLRRFGSIPIKMDFSVLTRGLHAGMTVPINLPKHGINASFVIERITLREMPSDDAQGKKILKWRTSALSGEWLGDEMDFWRKALATD